MIHLPMSGPPSASYVMSVEEQENFNPVLFVERLKSAGFKFLSEDCPIKLAGYHQRLPQEDGSVIWRQWVTSN